jgi:multicomponent Na+:H+ antiporter subunit E
MVRAMTIRAVALFAVWLLLTQKLDAFYLVLGALSALVIARLHIHDPSTSGMRWTWLLVYVPWLLWQVLKSGMHMTYLILHPRLPIDPKLVRFTTSLRDPAAITIFGNSVTLTPGTITAEVNGGDVVIHAMDDACASDLGVIEKTVSRMFGGDAQEAGPRHE